MLCKVKRVVTEEIDVRYVDIAFPVDEDDIEECNLTALLEPDRTRQDWIRLRIDADTGKIHDFKGDPDEAYHIDVKVRDEGEYQLISPTGEVIKEIIQNYVPHGICPGTYGDYIDLQISSGKVTNWPANLDISEFFEGDEDQ